MKRLLIIVSLTILTSTILSAQFVGDASPQTAPSAGSSSTKPKFTLKFGAAMPLSEFGTVPVRNNTPQYTDGTMGAKTGFFGEIGMGLNFTKPEKKVGFYYYPILASYWQTPLDWSDLGGFFSNKDIYTKPVSLIDIAQRYGIVVQPVKDLHAALYYRPGLVIPLKFEISHMSETDGEEFLFTGEASTAENAPVLMMSHTVGFSVRYKLAAISVEEYFSHPTYDITYKDVDSEPAMNVNETSTSKIPVKLLVVSLALSF